MNQEVKRHYSTSTIPIWVKDPYVTNPLHMQCEEDSQLIDFYERIIEERHFEQWWNAKGSFFTITHKGYV